MLEYLVVRLPAEPGEVTWVALDSSGERLSPLGRGSLAAAAQAARHRRVLLLVSGLGVVCARASLPVKNLARLQQMLPYSLEDAVAEDVDKLHFAAGSRGTSGETPVAVVSKRLLDGWLKECRQVGLSPERVYAESEGVPSVPGRLILVIESGCTFGRSPGQAPFALQGLALGEVLETVRYSSEDPSEPLHVVVYADEETHARCEGELAGLREQTSSLDVQILREGPLARFGSTLIHRPGSNLLQGVYGPKTDWGAWFKPWRLAAGLLLGFVLLTMLGEGVRYLSFSRENQALTALLETTCQRSVQSSDPSACAAEVRRRLGATGSEAGTDFLATLGVVTAAWDEDTRLEALSFRNGVMDLRVESPSVSALDEFTRRVNGSGSFQASIQSANPSEDGILGRLQVVEDSP